MPYAIRKLKSGKSEVYNQDTGESKGVSDSHEMAVQHLKALYVHENDVPRKKKKGS